jgi:hypothetical protein
MAASPNCGSTQHTAVFAYHPGECPAWKADDDLGPKQSPSPATQPAEFAPLAALLSGAPSDALNEVRRRVARLDRIDLIARYQTAYADGKRLVAYVMADDLIERGIPPCFWHETLTLDSTTTAQREVLTLVDLAWLRRWHPNHASAVRYQRGKMLLISSETVFHREAAFLFYQGQRPAWKIVGTLSMTEHQQWESAYLRSTPIKKAAEVTETLSRRVHQALLDDLRTIRRTTVFGEIEAAASLARRHALWRCSRMIKSGSPTEIAARYLQLTGTSITRQAAAKQLEKVAAVLREKGGDLMG